MKTIRTLIIDDERSARLELLNMLKNYPEIVVLEEAANADEAEELIELLKPDLIFLDIQMPGRSGFELLETLIHLPQVIFVTAYDRYALKAFEVSAMDYLMKPVREERFSKAIAQAIEKCSGQNDSSVFVKDRGRYYLMKWSSVYLIESMDNYARLYFGNEQVLMKTSLNRLEEKLDQKMFFRAGRSQIFNLNFIKTVKRDGNGILVALESGTLVKISERQAIKFKSLKRE
jgi:two-component system LytT family response regulator